MVIDIEAHQKKIQSLINGYTPADIKKVQEHVEKSREQAVAIAMNVAGIARKNAEKAEKVRKNK